MYKKNTKTFSYQLFRELFVDQACLQYLIKKKKDYLKESISSSGKKVSTPCLCKIYHLEYFLFLFRNLLKCVY